MQSLPGFEQALRGLEQTRKTYFEEWLNANGLDIVVFPGNADAGRADSDVDEKSCAHAYRNGVMYSNGNRAIRHLGISASRHLGISASRR